MFRAEVRNFILFFNGSSMAHEWLINRSSIAHQSLINHSSSLSAHLLSFGSSSFVSSPSSRVILSALVALRTQQSAAAVRSALAPIFLLSAE
jgi:hypothetical protein